LALPLKGARGATDWCVQRSLVLASELESPTDNCDARPVNRPCRQSDDLGRRSTGQFAELARPKP
jgi:hypothetical protein